MNRKKIIFIVGPTAVGKTEVSLDLAKNLNAEIISCDAMQVYREISVASNKPSQQVLKMIPHHLLNIVSIRQEFDVANFNRRALKVMQDIQRRKKIPIFSGGSGMYVGVLLDGIFQDGPKDAEVRQRLVKRIEAEGNQAVYDELLRTDPRAAAKIHPNDTRRMIRALEVFEITGQAISQLQKNRKGLWQDYDVACFALNRERQDLYERINQRVENMFEAGLVDEIKKLNRVNLSSTARSIIGIEETRGFLNGQYDAARAKYLIKLNTRHYAKRQLTWLRREKRLQWIMIGERQSSAEISRRILKMVQSTLSDELSK